MLKARYSYAVEFLFQDRTDVLYEGEFVVGVGRYGSFRRRAGPRLASLKLWR